MQPDLERWLDDVWNRRADLLVLNRRVLEDDTEQRFIKGRGASAGLRNDGVWEIYQMYNATSGDSSSDLSDLLAMQLQLVLLEGKIKKPPEVQVGSDFTDSYLGWMDGATPEELSRKFFHYRRVENATSVYRIYVNAMPAARGLVFRNILADHRLWEVDGLHNAKLASPDFDGRVDTIVIYLGTAEAVQAALGCIRAYHAQRPGYFGGALPKLVQQAVVDGYRMPGVGTAMEPPSFTLISTGGNFYSRERGQSFGQYRSELIFMALERTRLNVTGQLEQQRKFAFKNRVTKYFRRAGIDPDNPAQQAAPEALPPISEIKNWANTVDEKEPFV